MGLGMLPALSTPFIGRARDVVQLARLVEAERLVSLVGSPGCGKTRLALEVGRALAARLPGGVHFVELAPTDPTYRRRQAAGFGFRSWPSVSW
jgi:predicted ATPase